MGDLERIEAKVDWLVASMKHLLSQEIDAEDPEWIRPYIEPEEEFHARLEAAKPDMSEFEHIAVRNPPRPKRKPCPHNQQAIVDGNLQCARCGHVFGSSGVVQNKVGSDGRVIADPNPPQWATEHSPGASSKNPGTPLVPHSS